MAYIRKPSIPKPINQTKGEKKICVSNVDSNSVDVREIKRNYVIQQRGKIKMKVMQIIEIPEVSIEEYANQLGVSVEEALVVLDDAHLDNDSILEIE